MVAVLFMRPPRQALVQSHYSIELFWYPLNTARITGFSPAAWDPYADRLMVYLTRRAAAPPGSVPAAYSSAPNVAANLETALGYVASNVGMQTGNLAVQARSPPVQHRFMTAAGRAQGRAANMASSSMPAFICMLTFVLRSVRIVSCTLISLHFMDEPATGCSRGRVCDRRRWSRRGCCSRRCRA